jgi:hypothetical protein
MHYYRVLPEREAKSERERESDSVGGGACLVDGVDAMEEAGASGLVHEELRLGVHLNSEVAGDTHGEVEAQT